MTRVYATVTTYAIHPGEIIQDELDARGWSRRDLAGRLGMDEQTVDNLTAGKQNVSSELATALGEAFGVSAEFFTNLQEMYESAAGRTGISPSEAP